MDNREIVVVKVGRMAQLWKLAFCPIKGGPPDPSTALPGVYATRAAAYDEARRIGRECGNPVRGGWVDGHRADYINRLSVDDLPEIPHNHQFGEPLA